MIDDLELTKFMGTFDNTNLSVHPALVDRGFRATTERLAQIIAEGIAALFPGGKLERVQVSVHETSDISATHTVLGS